MVTPGTVLEKSSSENLRRRLNRGTDRNDVMTDKRRVSGFTENFVSTIQYKGSRFLKRPGRVEYLSFRSSGRYQTGKLWKVSDEDFREGVRGCSERRGRCHPAYDPTSPKNEEDGVLEPWKDTDLTRRVYSYWGSEESPVTSLQKNSLSGRDLREI